MAIGDNDDVIDEAVVRIGPDTTGFRPELKKQVKQALAGLDLTAKVKLVADGAGFNASARAELAKQAALRNAPTYKVRLVADATGFTASARTELRKAGRLTAKVRLEAGGVTGISGRRTSSEARAEAAAKKAEREAKKAERILFSRIREPAEKFEAAEVTAYQNVIRKLVNSWEDEITRAHLRAFEEDKRVLDRLHAEAIAMDKDRYAKSAEGIKEAADKRLAAETKAQERATAIAERESNRRAQIAERESRLARREAAKQFQARIIDWGGKGIRPMNLLLASAVALSPALIAVASSAVQASTSIAALGAAAVGTGLLVTGLTVAFSGLTNLLALRKTVTAQDAAEQANSAATAASNAAEELRNRNNLIDAQKAQLQAEKDLHDARREAARDLVNLRQKVRELQEQQREDDLSAAEAAERNARVQRSFFATTLEKARAAQDVRSARVRQAGSRLDLQQNKEDLAESIKKGVAGADKVTQAAERLRQARARAAEARLTSANAKIAGSAVKASSAQANLDQALKDSSPALREMYGWVVKNEERFKSWRRSIEQAFLPGFNTLLNAISTPGRGRSATIDFFIGQMNELGRIVSKYAGRFGQFTNTPFFRERFASIQEQNAASLENLGHAAETVQRPLLRIFEKAAPLLTKFTGELDQFATWLDDVIERADKSGSLATWFEDAGKEMGEWIGIAKNLLAILGNVFKASLPSGQSLVDRLRQFTGELAKWTGSREGQAKMKAFFDFFKNLPYGKIGEFFAAATGLFLAFRTAKFAAAHPIWAALGVLAAANPAGAAALASALAEGVTATLEFMAAHPTQTAALLAMLSYAKLRKSFGLDLRLPALDRIKDALTSRFKTLDGVFGGSMKTATMTVHASVVNVYGAATTPGKPGSAATPVIVDADGPDGKGKGTSMRAAAGGIALVAGTTLGSFLASAIETKGMSDFQKGMIGGLQGALTGAALGALLGPVGAAAGGAIGAVVGAITAHQERVRTAAERESQALTGAKTSAKLYARSGPGGKPPPVNDPAVLQFGGIAQYVAARKASVKARYEQAKAAGGEALAEKVLTKERAASVNSLAQLLQTYNYTAPAAQKAAMQILGSSTAMIQMNGSAKTAADLVKIMGDEVATSALKVGDLNTKLDKFSGTRVATLEINGDEVVFASLREAAIFQSALLNGWSLETAAGKFRVAEDATRNRLYGHAADGGLINGWSPHPKADNIPTMLTANEFVQPVDAVRHYGVGFMEAVRTKKLPRFADGGMVTKYPFKVDVSKTKIPQMALPADAAGGVASGDVNVARIAEAVARSMGASDKQLISLMEAGLVESGLRNLTRAVDHDSLGFLQQRPSQGWGSPAQVTNVAYATRKFIEAAMRRDRAAYTPGQLAQAVQRSAFPDRYDKRYADAVAVLNLEAPFLRGGLGSLLTTTPYAGKIAAGLGNVRNVSAAIYDAIVGAHRTFPWARVSSSFREGSITTSGNLSYHARNPSRAADFSPHSMALFNYFASRYPNARELIYSPAGKRQIHNGEPHVYSGAVRAQHWNHIHLALANGGLVPARKYDTGGSLPPGFTLAYNGTGQTETVRTAKQEKALQSGQVRLHRADIALLATQLAAAASPTVQMDGRRVAEITNQYTYLPAGV